MTDCRPAIRRTPQMVQVHTGTRPGFVRICRVLSLLSQGGANASTLARELNVNPKTIHRDLACLRNDMGVPIQYNHTTHAYQVQQQPITQESHLDRWARLRRADVEREIAREYQLKGDQL